MTGQFEIRPRTAVDAPALSLLGQATFLEAFAGILDGPDILAHCARAHAADLYASWLADERYRIWMALAQPGLAPVGYAVLAPSDLPVPDPRPGELEVKRIYLLNRFQGSGLGRRLMATAIEQARAACHVCCWVFTQRTRPPSGSTVALDSRRSGIAALPSAPPCVTTS